MIRRPCCPQIGNYYVGGNDDVGGAKKQATVTPIRIQRF